MLTEWPLQELVGNGRKKYIYEVSVCLFMNETLLNDYLSSYLKTNRSSNIGKNLLPMRSKTQRNLCTRIVSCSNLVAHQCPRPFVSPYEETCLTFQVWLLVRFHFLFTCTITKYPHLGQWLPLL